jgi:3-deoxy-7-phosphoheptulonate synthase
MQLPTPQELKAEYTLSSSAQTFIENSREQIKEIITGNDARIALVMGPCSIHDLSSAYEYAKRLLALGEEVKKSFLLVMRVHVEKPRTRLGWKGFLHDPFLNGSDDIVQGLKLTRRLLVQLAEMGIATAAECVDPLAHLYFTDLLSWGFIGARTSSSQPHRILASSLSIPMGFKNPTDGDLDTAINGVVAAHHPHAFLTLNEEGRISTASSQGNPFAHLVLRGSTHTTNYDPISTQLAARKLRAQGLSGRYMIDCAHGNCEGAYFRQTDVFSHLIGRIAQGDTSLFGLMLESHLEEGNRLSLTDPCIDWDTTEDLVLKAHNQLCSSISCC